MRVNYKELRLAELAVDVTQTLKPTFSYLFKGLASKN